MANDAQKRALAEKADRDAQEANTRGFNEAAPRSMGTFKGEDPKKAAGTFGGMLQKAVSGLFSARKKRDEQLEVEGKKRGGRVKAYAKGGSVTRGDGCATKGKTKGRIV